MGMSQDKVLLYGFKIPRDLLIAHLVDLWDDKYRPYIEGQPDCPFSIFEPEGSKNVFFGKYLSYDEDDEDVINFKDLPLLDNKLKETFKELFKFSPKEDPELRIFSIY
jgi:hypothetical protein